MSAKQTKGAGASKAGGTASAVTVGILVRAVTDGLAAQPKAVCPRTKQIERTRQFPRAVTDGLSVNGAYTLYK